MTDKVRIQYTGDYNTIHTMRPYGYNTVTKMLQSGVCGEVGIWYGIIAARSPIIPLPTEIV